MIQHVERITLIVKLNYKTSTLKSTSCDYGDAYILVSGTMIA